MNPSHYVPGKVTTVTGQIAPEELGPTMVHEHVFCDLRSWCHPPAEELNWRREAVDVPVSAEVLGVLRRDPFISRDNSVLDNQTLAVAELERFAQAGGGTIVEMSCIGLGGQRALLPQVARRACVSIVAAAGFYKEEFLNEKLRTADEAQLADVLEQDLVGGGPAVPAGVIGEIGTSNPITTVEKRTLSVAASVAADYGLSLHIHLEPGARDGLEAMAIANEFLPVDRVVLGHIDLDPSPDRGYIRDLAETGAFLAFDTFGLEHVFDSLRRTEPRDSDRIGLLLWLLGEGHEQRVVLSQDVATKTCLRAFGGYGYDHVLRDIVPVLKLHGVQSTVLDRMLIEAPAEILPVADGNKSEVDVG